jgi:hypothetical protein
LIRNFQRRLIVLLIAGAAAVTGWWLIPGSPLDRAAFTTVAKGFANPPFFVAGHGSVTDPWSLRTLAARPLVDATQAPFVVGIGDDEGYYQSSPPSPIDLAVMLSKLRGMGAERVAISALMAWENPNTLSLTGLERELRAFSSILTAAPLSRGSVSEALPRAFREGSLPASAVAGDLALLPVVNRIPLPGLILGGEGAKAGFSVIESEPEAGGMPLLALWDDRLLLAFPLLYVLERDNLPLSGVEVRLGEYLRLSPAGPTVMIDATGRLVGEIPMIPPTGAISADALLEKDAALLPADLRGPVVLRDEQSAADAVTRRFTARLPGAVATIASDSGLAKARLFRRLPQAMELAWLGLVVVLFALSGTHSGLRRWVGLSLVLAVCVAGQWLAAGIANLWLPVLPSLAAALGLLVCLPFLPSKAPASVPRPQPPPRPKADPQQADEMVQAQAAGEPPAPAAPTREVPPTKPVSPGKKPAQPPKKKKPAAKGATKKSPRKS